MRNSLLTAALLLPLLNPASAGLFSDNVKYVDCGLDTGDIVYPAYFEFNLDKVSVKVVGETFGRFRATHAEYELLPYNISGDWFEVVSVDSNHPNLKYTLRVNRKTLRVESLVTGYRVRPDGTHADYDERKSGFCEVLAKPIERKLIPMTPRNANKF